MKIQYGIHDSLRNWYGLRVVLPPWMPTLALFMIKYDCQGTLLLWVLKRIVNFCWNTFPV